MSAFTQDVVQRKDLARQSRHRKNGSKSKKCSLPSDKITQKQWKDRCGELMVYKLGEPMSWERFKAMPLTHQTEYIVGLQEKYGATCRVLSDMFDITPSTLHKHVKNNGLDVNFRRGTNMTYEQHTAWKLFLDGACASDNVQTDSQDVCCESKNCVEPDKKPNDRSMVMDAVTLVFSGKVDVDMIANSLRNIVGDSEDGTVKIEYTRDF